MPETTDAATAITVRLWPDPVIDTLGADMSPARS